MVYMYREGAFEYAVGPSSSQEVRELRGTGFGNTFVANPLQWSQTAVIGSLTFFMRKVSPNDPVVTTHSVVFKQRIDDLEYVVGPSSSREIRELRGTGFGDTFVANPLQWSQAAIIGSLTVFVRKLRDSELSQANFVLD